VNFLVKIIPRLLLKSFGILLKQGLQWAVCAIDHTLRSNGWNFEVERMGQSMAKASERRGRQRFSVNAPLTVFVGEREITAYTRDLSNRGVYFYLGTTDSTMIGREFEFMVELPPEITLSSCCQIRCRGRAVRTETASTNLMGIAAEILSYSIFHEATSVA
jgi:hypothetical protein